ncbi:F-box protein [Tripterygium wilfordii]|uniref:F-box protein n=1 Tax=Tripterygium wilfordii TaxID=458696 RepID=A0A7J7CTF5_TRIWF|nr:F-box protein [Tripterygium wilfordii]
MEERESKKAEEATWNRETVPKVMKIVSTKLSQRDLISLLVVSPWLHRTLISYPSMWKVLDFREMNHAGDRLIAALSLSRYQHVEQINLEFGRDIEDTHLERLKEKVMCIKLTDGGLKQILSKCSFLQSLNLYALSSFTDEAYAKISLLSHLRFLDLCGAQNISDESLSCIAKCKKLVSLNLTWCVQITDAGVMAIAQDCTSLEFLSLFGIVGVTDKCLEVLSRFCSNTLTTLDVNGCIGIKHYEFILQYMSTIQFSTDHNWYEHMGP